MTTEQETIKPVIPYTTDSIEHLSDRCIDLVGYESKLNKFIESDDFKKLPRSEKTLYGAELSSVNQLLSVLDLRLRLLDKEQINEALLKIKGSDDE